jgi:hypothetical protein
MFSTKLHAQQETRSWEENDILVSTASNECTGASGEGQPTVIPLDLVRKNKKEGNTPKITVFL